MEITKKTHAPHTKYLIAPTPHTLVEIRPSRPSNRSHRLPPLHMMGIFAGTGAMAQPLISVSV